MDQDRFESAVIALASEGVALTVANVAARTGVAPRKAEAMLDEMVRTHNLESDVDEKQGVIVYRVRGLSPNVKRVRVAEAESRRARGVDDVKRDLAMAAGEVMVRQAATRAKDVVLAKPKEGEKSIALGGLLGLLGPWGLAYSAPWVTVLLTSAAYIVALNIPIIRTIVGMFAVIIHVACALAGLAYAWRFNQNGKRTPLLPPERKAA
jgi:hypothetical protein